MREQTEIHGQEGRQADALPAVFHMFQNGRLARSEVVLAVLLFASLAGGCSSDSNAPQSSGYSGVRKPGQVDLQPMNLAGFRSLVARQQGKVVVVDVWATYCPPCMRDFHHLVELHREENPRRVVCMSLNIDYQRLRPFEQLIPGVLQFLEKQKATFDNILMTEDADHVYRSLGLIGIPAILVYDQQGRLVEAVTPQGGESPYVRVRQLIGQLLAKS